MEQTIYIRTNERNEIIETCSSPIINGIEYKGTIDFQKLLYAKFENGQIVYDEIAYHKDREQENKKARISDLKSWFNNDYRMYVEMLTRREALNISDTIVDSYRNKTYTSLNDLYLEAEVVASEIKNLENQIN